MITSMGVEVSERTSEVERHFPQHAEKQSEFKHDDRDDDITNLQMR